MRSSNLLLCLACLSLAACAPREQLTTAELAVEEQILNGMIENWERVVNSRKVDSMTMFNHKVPGFVGIWSDGRRTLGWEAESLATEEFVARTTAFNLDVQEPNVQVLTRSVALTTFRHALDLTDSLTGRALFPGYGTIIWMKDPADGMWKVHARQISRNPAPPPARRR